MPQYFVPPENISEGYFYVKGPEAVHIAKAARHKAADLIEIFDGQGRKLLARLDRVVGGREVEGTILSEIPEIPPRCDLRLFMAMIQRERFEAALEKGVEIGVSRFCPILTARTEVKLRSENRRSKLQRWSQVVMAACKQSGRARLPTIDPPISFEKALELGSDAPTLLAWEKEKSVTLERALGGLAEKGKGIERLNLFIGPEGGFTEEEVRAAIQTGAVPFTLGPHILRAETAAIVASALILFPSEPVAKD